MQTNKRSAIYFLLFTFLKAYRQANTQEDFVSINARSG